MTPWILLFAALALAEDDPFEDELREALPEPVPIDAPEGPGPEPPYRDDRPLLGFEEPPEEDDDEETEPPEDVEEPEPLVRQGEDGAFEVIVWGEQAIRSARQQVVDGMVERGWSPRYRADRIVFVPPRAWMGRAHLDREGVLSFGRPVVAVAGASARSLQGPYDDFEALSRDRTSGAAIPQGTFWILPSRARLDPVQAEVAEAVEEELRTYRLVLQETRFQEALQALPGQLDALWEEGRPLEEGPALETPEARRRAVLDYWASRAATPHGHQTMAAVERWLLERVMPSAWPVTAEEQAAANARRDDGIALELIP